MGWTTHQEPLCQKIHTKRLSTLISEVADDLWHLSHKPEQYRGHPQGEAGEVLVTAANSEGLLPGAFHPWKGTENCKLLKLSSIMVFRALRVNAVLEVLLYPWICAVTERPHPSTT